MAYKITGNLNEDARIIILQESDYTTEATAEEIAGDYAIDVAAGNKTVIARKANGHSISYGNVAAEDIAPQPVWTSYFTYGSDWREFTEQGNYHEQGEWVDPVPGKAYPGYHVTCLAVYQYVLTPAGVGTWHEGYRPTKVRVTWESTVEPPGDYGMYWMGGYYGNFATAWEVDTSLSSVEHDLPAFTEDVFAISFRPGSGYEVGDFYVTNIEFYGIPV